MKTETTEIKEIEVENLSPQQFIKERTREIKSAVRKNRAIAALSGGVDSSVVTMLGHLALRNRLEVCLIDNGLMRKNEPELIVSIFEKLGIRVKIIDARKEFFSALKGITDPEDKREAVTKTFYEDVFGRIVRESGAKYLLQGTNFLDWQETAVLKIKRQHNILINPQESYGYAVIEPLIRLRKPAIRIIAKELKLPEGICARMPFPGPGLATRVIGEVAPEKIALIREATEIVEEKLLKQGNVFQCMAILHEDRVTGMKLARIKEGEWDYQRVHGMQIEIRCWQSIDAGKATPKRLDWEVLEDLANKITIRIPEVVSVTYNVTRKPPSTMEAI